MRIIGIDPGTRFLGWALLDVADRKAQVELMGVLDLAKYRDQYAKLAAILKRITQLLDDYRPEEMAIESPFFGKNVQSMLKLGRAQGVCIALGATRGVKITEYAPMRIKQAITGRGDATKETVAQMLQRVLTFSEMPKQLDATDALAAAYCHFLQLTSPTFDPAPANALTKLLGEAKSAKSGVGNKKRAARGDSSWEDFVRSNPDRAREV